MENTKPYILEDENSTGVDAAGHRVYIYYVDVITKATDGTGSILHHNKETPCHHTANAQFGPGRKGERPVREEYRKDGHKYGVLHVPRVADKVAPA